MTLVCTWKSELQQLYSFQRDTLRAAPPSHMNMPAHCLIFSFGLLLVSAAATSKPKTVTLNLLHLVRDRLLRIRD